jgi:hypothetical protein
VLYNILTEFSICMYWVVLIKMCLNETYGKVCIGKNVSYAFTIRHDLKQ